MFVDWTDLIQVYFVNLHEDLFDVDETAAIDYVVASTDLER